MSVKKDPVAARLKRWGFSEDVVQKFQDEKITEDLFPYLDESTISLLLPLVGDRLRFKLKFEAEFVKKKTSDVPCSVLDHDSSSKPSTPVPEPRHRDDLSNSEPPNKVIKLESPIDSFHRDPQNDGYAPEPGIKVFKPEPQYEDYLPEPQIDVIQPEPHIDIIQQQEQHQSHVYMPQPESWMPETEPRMTRTYRPYGEDINQDNTVPNAFLPETYPVPQDQLFWKFHENISDKTPSVPIDDFGNLRAGPATKNSIDSEKKTLSDVVSPTFHTLKSNTTEAETTDRNLQSSVNALLSSVPSTSSTSKFKSNSESSYEVTSRKKRKTLNNSSPTLEADLKTLLEKDGDGILISKSYKNNNNFLPKESRDLLTQLIIKWERDRALEKLLESGGEKLDEFKISPKRFISYSEQIVSLFSGEKKETYYSAFKSVNGERVLANGKLWDRYNYVKTLLRKQGLMKRGTSKKMKRGNTATDTIETTDEEKSMIEWLRNHCEPWHQVLNYWIKTFETRRKLLFDKNFEAYEYFQQFVGFRKQEGTQLIEADFFKLYHTKTHNLFRRWNAIKNHLICKFQQSMKKVKSPEDKEYIDLLPTLSPEKQDAVIFFLLPYLIDSQRTGQSKNKGKSEKEDIEETDSIKKKRIRKLPVDERRRSFTLQLQNVADLEKLLEERKSESWKAKRSLQPCPVIVGSIVNFNASYVIVDDFLYKTPTYLHAVDLTFKITYAINCGYSENACDLWLFLQKVVYQIENASYYKYSPSFTALVGELETVIETILGEKS